MSSSSPPWHYFLTDPPEDGQICWIVRIGQPERPALATFQRDSMTFDLYFPPPAPPMSAYLCYRWRSQSP